jgi:putative transcriptional regulator
MIRQHPAPEVLAAFAAGSLHGGAMLVIACHVDACAVCRAEVSLWESTGGAFLEASETAALSEDAFDRLLPALDAPAPRHRAPEIPKYLRRFDVPAPLLSRRIGMRRWVTPNIWFAPIAVGAKPPTRTYLVYSRRNTMFPEHTHVGREFTYVLHGSFSDATGTYGKGDLAETDESVLHSPTVTGESDCLCLSSADAPMRLLGLPARIIQVLAGRHY